MSGRLTPAAATLINSSPTPGFGMGRRCGTRASGPPGVGMAMAVISAGSATVMRSLGTDGGISTRRVAGLLRKGVGRLKLGHLQVWVIYTGAGNGRKLRGEDVMDP